ncbi:MAG: 50S ribosomal protein L32 [bacterium]|nr:50S ribosomal protein L32 [bacterium]
MAPESGAVMVPVKKTSKCRKRKRRSHHALSPVGLAACPKCGKKKLPHAACGNCGYVSGKLALPVKESAA